MARARLLLCVQQTQKGKCKEAELICIVLLFHRRQNVLEHEVMTESPTAGYITYRMHRKGGRRGA